MSSHPGCTIKDAVELAEFLHRNGRTPEQVQDFYPTPGTLSTCMYYTGIDPRDMSEVYVAKNPKEKAMQRALLQWSRFAMTAKGWDSNSGGGGRRGFINTDGRRIWKRELNFSPSAGRR